MNLFARFTLIKAAINLGFLLLLLKKETLLVVTVATEETDGFKRFKRSLDSYNYTYEVNAVLFSVFLNGKRLSFFLHLGLRIRP